MRIVGVWESETREEAPEKFPRRGKRSTHRRYISLSPVRLSDSVSGAVSALLVYSNQYTFVCDYVCDTAIRLHFIALYPIPLLADKTRLSRATPVLEMWSGEDCTFVA